jgi:hypothetical protein
MLRFLSTLIIVGVIAVLPAHGQTASIDPGMSRAEVVERLGTPVGERKTGQFTYLFYRNGCEIRCGMQDLVILQDDMVVDAIFRSPNRTYSGASSSPTGITPEASGAGRARSSGNISITPASEATAQPSGGGIVTGTPTPPPATTPAAGPGSTGVSNRPNAPATNPAAAAAPTVIVPNPNAANPMTAGPTTGGARPATVPPLSPRDTTNVQPNRTTQGQLTPATKDAAPVPFTGSKPNPRDSAEKARSGQRPDSIKPPED